MVFVGGLDGSGDTPYLDPNYPGQGRGSAVYPGTSKTFRVANSNLLQVVANRNGDIIQIVPYLSQSDFATPTSDPPPNPLYAGPLTVLSTVPTASATGVSTSQVVQLLFNRQLNPATVSLTNVTISPTVVTAAVYIDPNNNAQIDFDPRGSNLASTTLYTVTASTSVKDVLGISLASPFSLMFTTGGAPPPDTTPPTVSSVTPTNGATGVSLNVDPVVVMSEAVQSSTVNTSNVVLLDVNSTPVSTSVSLAVDNKTITITPTASLLDAETYTIQVSGIRDIAGNTMSSTFTSTFTTTSTFTQFYNVSGTNAVAIGQNKTYFGCGVRVQTTSSQLIGKIARKVVLTVALQTGSETGSLVCHYDDNGASIVADFGSIDVTTLSTTPKTVTFELPSNNTAFVHGDWIGVHTSSVNTGGVIVYRSVGDAFDGLNTDTNYLKAGSSTSYVSEATDFACSLYQ